MRRDVPGDDELIDLIYAALLREASWQRFLDRLADTLPGGRATMFFHDADQHTGRLSLVSGFDAADVERYNAHFGNVNPWMPAAAVRPVGRGVVSDQMLPANCLVRTEFYNDYMRPIDCQAGVGITIVREGGCSFLLSILTRSTDAEANRPHADRLTRLAPHLRRAFDHYRRQTGLPSADPILRAGLEHLGIGVVALGMNGAVRFVSPEAQRLIDSDVGLTVAGNGRIRAAPPELAQTVEAMLKPQFTGPRATTTVMAPRGVDDAVGVTLIRISKEPVLEFFEGPTLLMLLQPLIHPADTSGAEALATLWNLTAAERRILHGLLAGLSVNDIAAAAALSRETVRSQLKAIFSKAGVSRQAELVSLASRCRLLAGGSTGR